MDNDLSVFGVVGETRAHVIRALVFLFDEPKDI